MCEVLTCRLYDVCNKSSKVLININQKHYFVLS